MARVVCVHGIGQQVKGEDSLDGEWVLPLRDGMRRAGAALRTSCLGPGTCGACSTGVFSARRAGGWMPGLRG